jgi:hypothetical protein
MMRTEAHRVVGRRHACALRRFLAYIARAKGPQEMCKGGEMNAKRAAVFVMLFCGPDGSDGAGCVALIQRLYQQYLQGREES